MRLALLGPPGAGKSTQARGLAALYGLPGLSMGDVLRTELASGTRLGCQARALLQASGGLTDELLIRMLARRLKAADYARGFVLDGIPRNLAQAWALDALLGERRQALDAVVELCAETAALTARSAGRFASHAGGRRAALQARLFAYHRQSAPLLPYYAAQDRLFMIDAMAAPCDVQAAIRDVLETRCHFVPQAEALRHVCLPRAAQRRKLD